MYSTFEGKVSEQIHIGFAKRFQKSTYIGVVAESLKSQLVKSRGETSEHALENLVGLATAEHLESILEESKGAALLELDNVLVADEVLGLSARSQDRGGLSALSGRTGESQRQEREEKRQTHCNCWL